MHFDVMGSTCAAGGLRDGQKTITAVEAADAAFAYELARSHVPDDIVTKDKREVSSRFTSFAKPGGAVVNQARVCARVARTARGLLARACGVMRHVRTCRARASRGRARSTGSRGREDASDRSASLRGTSGRKDARRTCGVEARQEEEEGTPLGWDTNRSPLSPTHHHRQVLEEEDRKRWKDHGVAFGTFTICAGDAYVIPAGVPHEFRNDPPSLSIAWNFLQPGAQASLLGLALTDIALTDVYKRFPYKPGQRAGTRRDEFVEHGPLELVASRCTPAADAELADARGAQMLGFDAARAAADVARVRATDGTATNADAARCAGHANGPAANQVGEASGSHDDQKKCALVLLGTAR